MRTSRLWAQGGGPEEVWCVARSLHRQAVLESMRALAVLWTDAWRHRQLQASVLLQQRSPDRALAGSQKGVQEGDEGGEAGYSLHCK